MQNLKKMRYSHVSKQLMEKIIIQTLAMILSHSAVLEVHRSQKSRWTSDFGHYKSFPAATFHPNSTIPAPLLVVTLLLPRSSAMIYPQNAPKAPEGSTKNSTWSPRSWKSPVWLFHKGPQQDPQGPEWHPGLHRTTVEQENNTKNTLLKSRIPHRKECGVGSWFFLGNSPIFLSIYRGLK